MHCPWTISSLNWGFLELSINRLTHHFSQILPCVASWIWQSMYACLWTFFPLTFSPLPPLSYISYLLPPIFLSHLPSARPSFVSSIQHKWFFIFHFILPNFVSSTYVLNVTVVFSFGQIMWLFRKCKSTFMSHHFLVACTSRCILYGVCQGRKYLWVPCALFFEALLDDFAWGGGTRRYVIHCVLLILSSHSPHSLPYFTLLTWMLGVCKIWLVAFSGSFSLKKMCELQDAMWLMGYSYDSHKLTCR